MTVCIAATFESAGIVGASDRMLTAGDVQFEPSLPKLRFFTNSIGAMIAGDANLQAEIIGQVWAKTGYLIQQNQDRWVPVRDMALLYKKECENAVRALAEDRILAPFGISMQDFMSRQKDFSPDFVKDIGTEILNFEAPFIQAIITGCDDSGPHIYTVSNESIECHDGVGFAAIGVGESHANSQMMAFSHTFRHSLADTLRAVFFAKKRAEIAPGVGPDTDMMICTGVGGLSTIADKVQDELEKRHAEETKRQKRVADTTREKINQFVQAILDKPAGSEQSQLPSSTTEPSAPASVEEAKT